jgi:hypothetical protein
MAVAYRSKVSPAYRSFMKEISRLESFDLSNQKKYANKELTKAQIELLVESIFFAGFRRYEGFIREIFLLYCMEKQPSKKPRVKSFLKPKSFHHSEQLIKSSMPFLDWTSPDTVIERAELYLDNGYPIKLPYTTNLQPLREFKKLRNHIAHNSAESQIEYEKVVRMYYGVAPLKIPNTGQYLMLSSKRNPANYNLLDFFDLMKSISLQLT